jgi:GTP-binding protein YchF
METALIGLPGCGKSTLFGALSGQSVAPGRRTLLAEVAVPDQRVERLGALFPGAKRTQATVLVKDLVVEFSPEGGLGPATLAELRTTEAITLVLRAFLDPAVPHPLETVDPARDLRRLLDSLIFSDYAISEARLERLVKEGRKASREHQLLEQISQRLGSGQLAGRDAVREEELHLLSGFAFLTAKPILVVANVGESSVDTTAVRRSAEALGLELFLIHGRQEMEIAQLKPEEQRDFLADLGLSEPTRDRFLHALYHSLNLISFLTANDKEVRAWSVPRGSTALRAAGRIHSDMEKGFIRAEAIALEELLAEGGFAQARKSGKLRLEGKEYTVQDGEVLTIRFNL